MVLLPALLALAQNFMVSAETGQPQGVKSSASGAYFQPIPNPKPGGPTHMINSGSAGPMLLGTFDNATEKLRINNTLGPQVLDSSTAFRWGVRCPNCNSERCNSGHQLAPVG